MAYMESFQRWAICAVCLLVWGCGQDPNTELLTNQDEVFSTAVQSQLFSVLEESQNNIISGVLETSELESETNCKPKFGLVLVGVKLNFTGSENCKLNGSIDLKFFPTVARANLDIVGLDHVRSLSFDADVDFSKESSGMAVLFEILEGHISLRNLPVVQFEDLVLTGKASFTSNDSQRMLQTRFNAFESKSGIGVAFLLNTSKNKLTDESSRTVQGCLLKNGVGTDPEAGSLEQCKDLGGTP